MENRPWDVLVVSSSLENRQDVAGMLFRLGVDPICVASVDQCKNLPRRENIGLVFCDRKVKGGDYCDVLSAVSSDLTGRAPKVVMMSELASPAEYQQVRRNGVFDVIPSPCRQTDIEWMVILAKRYSRRETKGLIEPTRDLSLLWKAAGAGA
jgi:DNA-binding NtrC family response regulator